MKKIKKIEGLFENDNEFDIVMGHTSYYQITQNHISMLVSSYQPSYIIEFGCGSGKTSLRLAKENLKSSVVGVDIRENIINFAGENKEIRKAKNLTLVIGDLTHLDSYNLKNVDIVVMLYAFNYIADPIVNKFDFLKLLFLRIAKGSRVIIGDWFLNDIKTYNENDIKLLYNARIDEGAKSVFWSGITHNSTHSRDIESAHSKFDVHKKYHKKMLTKILKREEVYPISKRELIDMAVEIGFTVELENYVNNTNDAVLVLRK